MAYKVFTNGSTLQASEVNDNLMKQAVAVFSNAAARTAAITSPVEGQITYLEDTNLYQHWNGSVWVSPFGATLVGSTTATAQTSVTLSNVFSSQFDNYQVLFRTVHTAATRPFIRLVNGATILSGSDYLVSTGYGQGTITNESTTGTDFVVAATATSAGGSYSGDLRIYSPFLTQQTSMTSSVIGAPVSGGAIPFRFNSATYYNGTTSVDGLNFSVPSGTLTGTIRVYGMRN